MVRITSFSDGDQEPMSTEPVFDHLKPFLNIVLFRMSRTSGVDANGPCPPFADVHFVWMSLMRCFHFASHHRLTAMRHLINPTWPEDELIPPPHRFGRLLLCGFTGLPAHLVLDIYHTQLAASRPPIDNSQLPNTRVKLSQTSFT